MEKHNYRLIELQVVMKKYVIRQSMDLPGERFSFPVHSIREFRNGIVVRMPNHLGDAVMALPALAALKKIVPAHCGIFVITPAGISQLYRALPFVDDIIPLAQPHRFWSKNEIKMVKQLRPGAAILFNHSLRDALCLKIAKVPELYGEPSRGRSFLLRQKFPFPKKKKGEYSSSHQTMRYLAIAEALGGEAVSNFMPEFNIPCAPGELTGKVPALFHHPLLLTLAPGAAYGAAKRWPHEYYAKVAQWWINHGGICALCGSKSEAEICEEIKTQLPANSCFNLAGKTDLFALMYIFRFSKFAITNDSGLMHLAAALNCPGLTVFGPTDLYDTGPVSAQWLMLHEREKCSPCLKRSCPQNNPVCTLKITPSKVIRVLNEEVKRLGIHLEKRRKDIQKQVLNRPKQCC